jgi:hypothetical protein
LDFCEPGALRPGRIGIMRQRCDVSADRAPVGIGGPDAIAISVPAETLLCNESGDYLQ